MLNCQILNFTFIMFTFVMISIYFSGKGRFNKKLQRYRDIGRVQVKWSEVVKVGYHDENINYELTH